MKCMMCMGSWVHGIPYSVFENRRKNVLCLLQGPTYHERAICRLGIDRHVVTKTNKRFFQ